MNTASLAAHDVEFGYQPTRPVLRAVSGSINAGEVTVVAGPNGAGKTTLLRVLLGLVRPLHGRATLADHDIRSIPATRRARHLAYLPQHPDAAFGFSVREVVRMGRYAAGALRGADDAALTRALDRVKLLDRADDPLGTLSAGQRQRASLARVLAQLDGASDPRFLLADEPVAALDPHHALDTMRLLRALAAEGVGVLVVLHELTYAARFADRALVLDGEGRVASSGPAAEALRPDRLEPVYGVPFARVGEGASAALVPLGAA